MALLNFSTHIRLINQMLLLFFFFSFSLHREVAYPLLLAICSSDCAYEQYTLMIKQSTNQSYLIVFFFYRNVLRVKDKNQLFFLKMLLENSIDNIII
jgi:hypothetical protein